jgi:hypothetical protein
MSVRVTCKRLDQAGIDPTIALQSGQLELRYNVGMYRPDGSFDQWIV